jgi:hypothetical protein
MGNESPKLPETRESLGNIRIFTLLKPNFPHTKFDFLQRLSAFFNGFPLSITAFQFSATAFHFLRNPRKSIYSKKYTKDHYLSFVFFATCSPSFVIRATMPTSHPTPLTTRPFIGTSYASTARYPMDGCDVIDIGLRIIKHCGVYAKENKNWILRENAVPPIVKTIDSFKEYWADMIAFVNQTAVLALQHGYGMTTMDNDALVATYNDSLANLGAAFAATQETMKSQADSLVAMQNQLSNIQLCMNVGQQPPSSGYAPAQQQHMFTNHNKCNGGGQGNDRDFPQQPTMNYGYKGGGQQQNICPPPNPYKLWENQNYCQSHCGDVDDNHTSATCGKPGPMHKPNAIRTNIMGGSAARMHKTILPLTSGRTPPNRHPQQQQRPQQRLPNAYYPPGGTAWQQPTPPAQYHRMPQASTYCQQTTMAMPVYQPGQGMMMNVGQFLQGARNMLMIQMGQQTMAVPMVMNHYAPNQQPNQMPGYF